MAEQTVELAPGESKEVSFEAIPHEAKTYSVSIDGLTGSFTVVEAPILYPCAYCPEKFATLDELEAHQRAEHPDMVEAAGGRIYYLCPYCKWGGWYRWDLYRHLWYHRPDIPKPEKYACHYCRSTFDTASQLMAHISSVHGLPAPTPTPDDAAFHLWDMSVSRAIVNQVCIVYLRIINYGGDTGEYNIRATIDGRTLTSTGKLTPAGQGSLEFRFTPTRAGTHVISANGFTSSFEVKVQPATIQIIGFSVPSSAKAGTAVSAVVTYQVTGTVPYATATLYATNEFVDRLATSPVNLTPGTHTLTLTFTAWRGTIRMNVYCYIEYSDGVRTCYAYSGVVKITITNLVY
ncbi:hypothetical protein ES703_13720 [subsurface metagenome]